MEFDVVKLKASTSTHPYIAFWTLGTVFCILCLLAEHTTLNSLFFQEPACFVFVFVFFDSSCVCVLRCVIQGLQQIYSESRMTVTDINNQVHLMAF
jgi:hypothetical protein